MEEFKDSQIQWVGKVPSHWEERKAKYVFKYQRKIVGERSNEYDLLSLTLQGVIKRDMENPSGKFPSSFDSYQEVKKGDFIFCLFDNEETPRTVGLSSFDGMITGAYDVFTCSKTDVLPKFILYYYLTIDDSKLMKPLYKGLRKTIPYDSFMRYRIPLPPLPEQKKIVSYLESKTSKIDAYVAEKEKELQLLNELKESVIANVVTRGLHPDVKMKDSGISWIGMIPEHWEVKRVASLFTGKVSLNSDFEYQHAYKFYYGTLVPKEEVGDIEEYRETYIKYSKITKNDILINGLNLNYDFVSQRVAIAPKDGIITSAYIVVRPRANTNAEYYTLLFKTMDNKKLFHGMGTGIRLTLSYEELKKQSVVVPPEDEQRAIVSYIDSKCAKINSLISDIESEIDYLKEYKQRLIADCVTGQIKV